MYVRCAYFEGTVAAAQAEPFRRHVETVLLPLMRALPGNRGARALWAKEHETGAAPVYLALEHSYDSPAALAAAIASPERDRMRARLDEVLPLFEGRIVHINYAVADAA